MIQHGQTSAELIRDFDVPVGRGLRVGLTGGIGSGKSSIGRIWSRQGAVVVEADQLAREVVAPGSVGLQRIVQAFGDEVLTDEGSLDRAVLASLVFADEQALRDLESITHPLIAKRKAELFASVGPGMVGVYDVPLLVEKRMHQDFDVIVVVDTNPQVRMERLRLRGVKRDDALRRMASQASDSERYAVANIWIVNDGTEESLEEVASQVGSTYFGLAQLN